MTDFVNLLVSDVSTNEMGTEGTRISFSLFFLKVSDSTLESLRENPHHRPRWERKKKKKR